MFQMWQQVDEERKRYRTSELSFIDAIYECYLRREKILHNKTVISGSACKTIGWELERMALISWMVDECETQHLQTSTLFLAVEYLDSLTALQSCTFSTAKHFSAVCILLAAKMNEADGDAMSFPSFDGVSICVGDELDVLEILEWQMAVPTAYTFLCFYIHRFWVPETAADLAALHLKRIVSNIGSCSFYPSTLALVAINLVHEQNQLPAACWRIITELLNREDGREGQVMMAVTKFRGHCFLSLNKSIYAADSQHENCIESDRIGSSSDGSSTTAYAPSNPTTTSSEYPDSEASSR